MADFKIDIIDGARGELGRNGWVRERIATVYNVSGVSVPDSLVDIALAALQADTDTRSRIGDRHPVYNDITLEKIVPDIISTTAVRFRLRYEPNIVTDLDAGVIEVGAVAQQESVNTDRNDIDLRVTYNGEEQGGIVSAYLPQPTIRFTRYERGSPFPKAKQFVGRIAMAGWSIDPEAEDSEWMCTAITGRSQDRGVTYQVNYEFAWKKGGWDPDLVYIDPQTGRPPSDATDGNGKTTPSIYERLNFDDLISL